MYTDVSNDLITFLNSDGRTFIADIREYGNSVVTSNTLIKKISYTGGANAERYITLGSTVSAFVELTLYKPNFRMLGKEYSIHIGAEINGSPEYLCLGYFTAQKPVFDGEEVKVTLYDRMRKFETPFFSSLTYPATAAAVVEEICTNCNVPYVNITSSVSIPTKPEGYTCREMIAYIAQLLGGFAIINRKGKLEFKWYKDSGYTIPRGRYWDPFNRSESNYEFYRMAVIVGKEQNSAGQTVDKIYSVGSGTKGIIFENPFYTQSLLEDVYDRISSLTFRPSSVEAPGDPRLEPGDIITVIGSDGVSYTVPIMTLSFSYDGGLTMKIEAVGEEEQKDDFSVKGPKTQAMERMSVQLMLVNRLLANKIDADIVEANYVKTRELDAVNGRITNLETEYMEADTAIITRLDAVDATITDLNAGYAKIGVLEADYGSIRTLLAGNAAATQAEMIHLNAENALIDEAFLKSLMAQYITVNDLLAGTIYTNKHTVQSEDGALMMTGSLLTFKDDNDVIRIQIGKDGQGNYNYYLVNSDGDIIWDAAGITKDGVPDGLIVDDMVANSTANYPGISASKLNIHSMIGALNEEGGLKASSIVLDENNQSLTVAFTNMKESIDALSKGGRNLMLNTLVPDVSDAANYPKIKGQTVPTVVRGTAGIAEHGFKSTGSAVVSPGFRFGSKATGAMNGLEAGETYTISFDAAWKLFSADTGTDKKELYMVFGYIPAQSTDFVCKKITISEVTTGTAESSSFSGTFTVPENCIAAYIGIMDDDYLEINDFAIPNLPYAEGDFVEINGDPTQAASFSGNDYIEINGVRMPKQSSFCVDGDYIELRNLKLEKGDHATEWTPAPEDYLAATEKLNDLINGLQDQIDGVIDTYYYDYAPTLANIPASEWAAGDYPLHRGDMFLDTSTGKSYRFLQDEATQTWGWVEIHDTAVAQALIVAQEAKDAADHKRRVFVDTPSVPYDVGDIWFEGTSGDILTCTTARTETQSYAKADWSKLHKYTDDTFAANAYSTLEQTIDGIEARVGKVETITTSHSETIATHSATITQTANKVGRIISDSQIETLDAGVSMFDKLLSVEETADGVKSDVTSLKTWQGTASGQITSMESKQNTLERNLGETTSRVSAIETNITNNYSTTAVVQSLINQKADAITLSVSNTYATKNALDDLESRMASAELIITDDKIISAVSANYAIADANLIYNSTGYGSSTDGWELSNTSRGYELFANQLSTRPGKTDYALCLGVRTMDSAATVMRQTSAHWITVEQGKKYTFSGFYYKSANVRTPCYIGLEYSTDGGSTWNTSDYNNYGVAMEATSLWTSFAKTFEAPSNLVRVGIKAIGSSSASSGYMVYVSDLVLVRGEKPMPWAESPTSLIEQTSDAIRLKAEKLVWVANNSSLTEAGYLTVTGGKIGGFDIDSTCIRSLDTTSTSTGAVLMSNADVSRTIAGVSKTNVRLAVGSKFGVLSDGTLYAKDGIFSGQITATSGSFGGLKIGSNGIYAETGDGGTNYKRIFSISKTGTFQIYKKYMPPTITDPTQEEDMTNPDDYELGYFMITKNGTVKATDITNGYWRTNGRILAGYMDLDGPDAAHAEGTDKSFHTIRLYAQKASELGPDVNAYAMTITDETDASNPVLNYILRYSGAVQCTALTVMSLTSGTGSTVVANSNGRLFKSSSSKRYKDYIADMTESEAEKLYDLPVVQFKYKDGYLDSEDEMYDKPMHGFFAEDVADLFSDGGIHNDAGDVENYSERAIIARLVKLVQMQHEEIKSLKASMY